MHRRKSPSLVEDVIEATVGGNRNMFTLGPGFDLDDRRFKTPSRRRSKRKRKSRRI